MVHTHKNLLKKKKKRKQKRRTRGTKKKYKAYRKQIAKWQT